MNKLIERRSTVDIPLPEEAFAFENFECPIRVVNRPPGAASEPAAAAGRFVQLIRRVTRLVRAVPPRAQASVLLLVRGGRPVWSRP